MAGATINVSAGLRFTAGNQSQGLTPAPNYTQVGSHAISAQQDATTAAASLSVGSIATLKYATVYNPSDSGATLTVTCAPQVLAPGDAALIRSPAVTLQATSAVTIPYAAAEA
jgi:hypothetical protein